MWVLIIILMAGNNMPAVTTAEFTSKDRCEAADKVIEGYSDKLQHPNTVLDPVYVIPYTYCVEK